MAFTPEDGTGVVGANAYIDVAFADGYQDDRARTDWTPSPVADKQSAIIRASDYIDERFGRNFRGFRFSLAQGLEWPRASAWDNDGFLYQGVPTQLQKACAEYALISLRQGELAPNPPLPTGDETLDGTAPITEESNSGIVTKVRSKVGPLEEETSFASMATVSSKEAGGRVSQASVNSDFYIPEYPRADLWLEELIINPYSRGLIRG